MNDGETLRFDDLKEMLAAGPDASDITMTWNDRDWTTSIRLHKTPYFDSGVVELSLSLDAGHREAVRDGITAFERDLGLTALNSEPRQAARDEDLTLTYQYENDDFEPRAAFVHMERLFSEFQTLPGPEISIERRSENGGLYRTNMTPKDLPETSAGLNMISLRLTNHRGGLRDVELRFHAGSFRTTEITCHLAPHLIDGVKRAIRHLEQAVGLTLHRVKDADVSLHGEERIHFAEAGTEIDLAWFRSFLECIDGLIPRRNYFQARIRLVSLPLAEATLGDPLALADRLATKWNDLLEVQLSYEGPAIRFETTIEPKLDWVHMKLWAADDKMAAGLLDKLAADLGLDRFETNPYERPVTQKTYAIGYLDRAAFVTAVKDVVGPDSRSPLLGDSFVSEREAGGELQNTYFDDFEEMLVRIATGEEFAELHMEVRKPKGDCISFAIDEAHATLVVKSSFETSRFAGVKKTLTRRLSLSEPGNSDSPGAAPRGFFSRKLDPTTIQGRILILVFAGLTGIGGFLADRLFPDIALTITVPRAQDAQPASLVAGCVNVIWVIRQDEWFSEGTERLDGTGTVTLARSDASRTFALIEHRSGDKVHIAPGGWDIFIHDPQLKRTSAPVRIEAANSDYAARLQGIEAECGPLGG